jgi:hypothetical protein
MYCAPCRTDVAINTSLAPARIQLPFPDTFLVALLLHFHTPPPYTLLVFLCCFKPRPHSLNPKQRLPLAAATPKRAGAPRFKSILLVTTSFSKLFHIKWTATRRPLFSAEWTNSQSLIKCNCSVKYPVWAMSRLGFKSRKELHKSNLKTIALSNKIRTYNVDTAHKQPLETPACCMLQFQNTIHSVFNAVNFTLRSQCVCFTSLCILKRAWTGLDFRDEITS